MSTPQSGITSEANNDALFLVLTINKSVNTKKILQVCSDIPHLTDKISMQHADARLTSTISIGSNAWDLLYPKQKPDLLHPFVDIYENDRKAPATPGDLLLHIRSNRKDINFILMYEIIERFGDSVSIEEEVYGFRYLDSRDLTGFVDGTENPTGDNRAKVALINSQSIFDGGSYIHCQRYIHKLKKWNNQTLSEQEQIIGRTKKDNIEFESSDKAPFAHIKRVTIEDSHNQSMEILRHSMPYGTAREAGLFFISYASTPLHFEQMLEKMIKSEQPGHHDRLMDFSQAVTGCAFFAPSIEYLTTHR